MNGGKGPVIIPTLWGPPTGWPAPPATDVGVWVGGGGLLADKELHGVGSPGSDYGIIVRSCDGGRPYTPGTGNFGSPGAPGGYGGGGSPYGFGGGNPVGFGGGGQSGDESPDAGMNDSSDWGSYAGMFGAVNTGSGHAKDTAVFLGSLIPLEAAREAIAGNDAMGKKISPLDRALQAASTALPLIHGVAPLIKGFKGIDAVARDIAIARKAREAAEAADRAARAAAAAAHDRDGLTFAGRSLTKHASGQRPLGSKFPALIGNVANKNRIAQEIVNDILHNPGTVRSTVHGGNFPGGIRYTAPDGRFIVFDSNGIFRYFGE